MTETQKPSIYPPAFFPSYSHPSPEKPIYLPPIRTPPSQGHHSHSPPRILEPPSWPAAASLPTSPSQHTGKSSISIERLVSAQPVEPLSPRSFSYGKPNDPIASYSQHRPSPPGPENAAGSSYYRDHRVGSAWLDHGSAISAYRSAGIPPRRSHDEIMSSRRQSRSYEPAPATGAYPPSPASVPPPAPEYAAPAAPVSLKDPRWNHALRIRQQPMAARACGFGERDRRVVDPPPIVELSVTYPDTGQVDSEELRYPFNVVHASLWNESGTEDSTMFLQADKRSQRRLMGTLVASAAVAYDDHDNEGAFFCFPDLSCRTAGRYRLRFVMIRIEPMNTHPGGFTPIVANVMSEVFTVYTAKEFPGMRPSTALTRVLKRQGISIQVKKGKQPAPLKRRRADDQDDEDDEEDGAKNASAGRIDKRQRIEQ